MDNSEKQMEMLLEEGGIADDGMNVDPVSGNEVPPGSMASEVRDDIPAQLSEGEYVVPADVLRFYGVKFFEDLRQQAKMGLSDMEANGRIGGEPVEGPAMGGGEELTREEIAEIESLMMAVGGYVPQTTQSTQPDPYMQQQAMYNQGAPVAMGNAGYNEGGLEDGQTDDDYTTAAFDPDMYQAGFSFLDKPAPAATESRVVTLYGPDGMTYTLTLPGEQERYDELVAQGYSETQPELTQDTGLLGDDRGGDGDSNERSFDVSKPFDNQSSSPSDNATDATGLLGNIASNVAEFGLDVVATAINNNPYGKAIEVVTGKTVTDILGITSDDDDGGDTDTGSTSGLAPGGLFGDVDGDGTPNAFDFTDGYGPFDQGATTPSSTPSTTPTPTPQEDETNDSDRDTSWSGGQVADNQDAPGPSTAAEAQAAAAQAAEDLGMDGPATRGR